MPSTTVVRFAAHRAHDAVLAARASPHVQRCGARAAHVETLVTPEPRGQWRPPRSTPACISLVECARRLLRERVRRIEREPADTGPWRMRTVPLRPESRRGAVRSSRDRRGASGGSTSAGGSRRTLPLKPVGLTNGMTQGAKAFGKATQMLSSLDVRLATCSRRNGPPAPHPQGTGALKLQSRPFD